MSEDLKPCPFCGSDNVAANDVEFKPLWWVDCYSCGASGVIKPTEAEAVAAWNTRAKEPTND